MKKREKIVPIMIVMIFLGIAISSGVNASDSLILPKENAPNPEVYPKTVSVWMPGITEDDYRVSFQINDKQLGEVNQTIRDLTTSLEQATGDFSPNGEEINSDEWDLIREKANIIIDYLHYLIGDDFPVEEAKKTINSVIGNLFGPFWWLRQPILSVGFGFIVVPFYDYETFIGRMFRPVNIWYLYGCSISVRPNPFRPLIPYGKIGLHRVRSMLFQGLLLDFGKLGFERRMGPQLLIGYGFNGIVK